MGDGHAPAKIFPEAGTPVSSGPVGDVGGGEFERLGWVRALACMSVICPHIRLQGNELTGKIRP